jgi:hypothetical protein
MSAQLAEAQGPWFKCIDDDRLPFAFDYINCRANRAL